MRADQDSSQTQHLGKSPGKGKRQKQVQEIPLNSSQGQFAMLPQEFEPAYMAASSPEDQANIRLIAGDWWEERSQHGHAAICRGETPAVLKWCPSGRFLMGFDRVPVVFTQGFWMDRYPVTQKFWSEVMGTTIRDQVKYLEDYQFSEGDNVPMYQVNWEQANQFCQKLTDQERVQGRLSADWEYRLPTEAQWEYACRAGSETDFCFGDDESQLGEYAWFGFHNGRRNTNYKALPVGTKKPNAWGLYDMHGNVWEWCDCAWRNDLIGGVNSRTDETTDSHRVLRGGSYRSSARFCQSSSRRGYQPLHQGYNVGFRCVVAPIESNDFE